jgi:hypothetical protein
VKDGAPPSERTLELFVEMLSPALMPKRGRSTMVALMAASIPDFSIFPTFCSVLLRKPFVGTERTLKSASDVVALK